MKYKEGDKMYYVNGRTKEVFDVEIIGIKYVFNRRIGQTDTFTEDQINTMIAEGKLSDTKESYIDKRISDLEKELGIKLKIDK